MFRVKIALLSVVLSGAVFVGLGLYSLSVMNRVGVARIDREILSLGEGHLALGPPREYWEHFDASLRFIYHEGASDHLVVQILDPGGEVLFKSPHWPAEIAIASFPGFDRSMEARRPRPVEQDGRRGPAPGDDRERRRGPPPGAYTACEGQTAGSTAQFVDGRGETVKGTCEDEDGRLVLRPFPPGDARSPDRQPPVRKDQPERPAPRIKKPVFATIGTTSGTWRAGIMGSERVTMMVGVNMASFYEDAASYRRALLTIVPFALLLLAAGGWLIAHRALKPVALITRTAEGISVRALDQRVPRVDADRELERLVEVINGMLERLEKSFSQAVRFSADAAHELQTPLTILQGELDDALQHAQPGSEEQQRYGGLLEEVQRLKTIVQKLLILARVDAGRLDLRLEEVDLGSMVDSMAEDASAIAPHLRIEKEVAHGIRVKADPDLLMQALRNLTTNAVKYNRDDGFVRFRLSASGNQARLTVSNSGTPIPDQKRDRIFDRFYRVDESRSGRVPGAGLGLSLALEIARAHSGDLRLDPASGDVTSFTLSLPCSAC